VNRAKKSEPFNAPPMAALLAARAAAQLQCGQGGAFERHAHLGLASRNYW